jgi:phosphoribosylanthranilate isomerase
MSRTKIKICGLKTKEAVIAADQADYAGFVVGSPRSYRNISLQQFEELRTYVKQAQPVLVTVNYEIQFLHRLQQYKDVIIQLHGEARKFYRHLNRSALGLNYQEYILSKYMHYDPVNFLSIDSIAEAGYGGTGNSWVWDKLEPMGIETLVAGGINQDNFEIALQQTGANGVDVSSAVEVHRHKQPKLITEFIESVREY